MTSLFKYFFNRIITKFIAQVLRHPFSERQVMLLGIIAARQVGRVESVGALADVEFRAFSQWGEDGIIEWLLSKSENVPEIFIEFGVENYRESNTRFLLQHRNWRGLVIDGSAEHVADIRADAVSWRHDLTAVCSFITSDNIERTIADAGFAGEIGILSIDIDGNDYWVWEAIKNVSPQFVIIEYNANFGDLQPLTVPYRDDFFRTAAHPSNLYFGASCRAFEHLASLKGYVMLGSNLAGNNLFFARADRAPSLLSRIGDTAARPSRFRECRNSDGQLALLGGTARANIVINLPVVDVQSGKQGSLRSFGALFSSRWVAQIDGQL